MIVVVCDMPAAVATRVTVCDPEGAVPPVEEEAELPAPQPVIPTRIPMANSSVHVTCCSRLRVPSTSPSSPNGASNASSVPLCVPFVSIDVVAATLIVSLVVPGASPMTETLELGIVHVT